MSKLLILSLGVPGASFIILALAAAGEALPSLTTLIMPIVVILLLVALNGFFVFDM